MAAELVDAFKVPVGSQPLLGSVTIVPSKGGVFEVSADGRPVYSKKQTGRHAEPGEVVALLKSISQ